MMWGFAALAVLLAAAGKKGGSSVVSGGDDNSQREDEPPNSTGLPVDPAFQPYVYESLLSWLYYWGGPKLPVAGLKRGAVLKGLLGDCGGLLWCLFIMAGVFPEDFPRLLAGDYQTDSRFVRVADSDIRPGDILCYPNHVAGCVGGYGLNCTVWSDSGGGRQTFGNNPNARPKLFKGPRYRKDFLFAVRRIA